MVQGNLAHDDVDAGYPVKIGGKAETTAPAAVSDGDRVNAWFDEYGRIVVALKDASGNQISLADDAAFTPGTSSVIPVGFFADETSPDSVTEGDIGAARMTLNRILRIALMGKASTAADTDVLSTVGGRLETAACSAPGLGDGRATGDIAFMRANDDAAYPLAVMPSAFNGTTWDRVRTIAASGAGLGVQQVGTLGELITLAASAARTASANGTAVTGLGWRNRYIILFDLTVADTDAGDTLDVYVDVSLDGSTWLNAVHFTQIIGTDAASKRFAVLDPSAPGTSEILVTADAAAAAVRPSLFGAQMRARWAIVDAGTDDASFTFSVTAYAI